MIDYSTELNKPFSEFVSELTVKSTTTFHDELGLKHPTKNVGIHLRDDNVLEFFAGGVSLILDGNTGSVLISGNHFVASTKDVNFLTNGNNSFGLNHYPLNSAWTNYGLLNTVVVHPELCPTTYLTPVSNAMMFLTGVPAAGQTLVPFNKVFSSKPLFNPESQSIATEMAGILAKLLS